MVDEASKSAAESPDLRIVPTVSLIPHELEDAQRAQPLVDRLPRDGALKNPPLVTPLTSERYVILDGTNRVIALNALGYEHALVQVVRYELPDVELDTWNHVVTGITPDKLRNRFASLPGLEVRLSDAFHARAALARRAILAYVLFRDGTVLALAGGGLDLIERTQLLQAVVDTYLNEGHLHRTNLSGLEPMTTLYPELSAAVIFPHYEHVEILDLAEAGLPVPTGITRHVIHGRALRINYPLSELGTDLPLEQKNERLVAWVREQFGKKRVRYYAESTYLFDE